MPGNHKPHILVVEDTQEHVEIVLGSLGNTYHIEIARTMKDAFQAIAHLPFDLVILDVSLPDGDGYQICSYMRSKPELDDIPVLFLSGTTRIEDKVTGFELGGDDFITKPCDPAELRARVASRLRRRPRTESLRFEGLLVSLLNPSVTILVEGTPQQLDLTPREFKLLRFFAQQPETNLTRTEILRAVWGENVYVSDRSIDTYVATLRKKLGPFAHYIKSVHGKGYKFSAPKFSGPLANSKPSAA